MVVTNRARGNPQSAIRNPQSILPLLICLAHFCLLAYLAKQHPFGTYSTETDFYHYYAPDAERLASGQFPTNTYQGPGYPATLALVAKLVGKGADLFTVGKWLSVVCAVLVGWLVFVLFARLWGYWVGVGAQLLVAVSGEFPQFSISATTDVFFLLLCLATLVAFTSRRLTVQWRVGLAAALASLSYLTRYNGLFLVAACLVGLLFFNLFELSWRARLRQAALFTGVFVLVALPWLYYNAKHHGSPLYNTNYLNIATEFYPELVKGKVNQDGTRALEDRFRSFGDVLSYDPMRLPRRYPGNLWESLRNIVKTTLLNQWVAWVALGGLLLVLLERRSKAALVLLVAGAVYLLLMALSHWETRYYFFVMVLSAGLAVYFIVRLFELARARGWLRHTAFALIPALLVGWLFTASLAESRKDVREFLESHPTEVIAARDYLQSVGECNGQAHKRIIARKPHIAYFCRAEWLFFPQVKSLDELRVWLGSNRADYLLVSQRELKERKELRQLGEPNKAPAWLQPVWSQSKPLAVLYRPAPNQE
jgi:4-amino-4-deoxy-L-arabinose transferase-like glycosyltransferase